MSLHIGSTRLHYRLGLELSAEILRQDKVQSSELPRRIRQARFFLALLEDEIDEVKEAFFRDRANGSWEDARAELLQVAALAIRLREYMAGGVQGTNRA